MKGSPCVDAPAVRHVAPPSALATTSTGMPTAHTWAPLRAAGGGPGVCSAP